MCCETIQEDPGKYLAHDGEQGYASMVIAGLAIPLPLIQVYDGGLFELLGNRYLLPHELQQLVELCHWSAGGLLFGSLARLGGHPELH